MVSVFIAAYNKGKYLESTMMNLIHAAKLAGNVKLDIIIIDDASTDNTVQVVNKLLKKSPSIRFIHHTVNKGLGYGFREAMNLAKYPKLLYLPGDDELNLNLVVDLLKNRNKADVILSYYLNREIRGRFRNFLSTFYGMIYMLTFDVYIQYFNGAGLYCVDKMKSIILRSNRFSITAEMNTKLLCSGCTCYEVPGYKKTENVNSTSFSARNFWEVIQTYFKLIYELKFVKRNFYNKKPVRIQDAIYK